MMARRRRDLRGSVLSDLMSRQGYRCVGCLETLVTGQCDVDHIVPLSVSGDNHARNLQVLCSSCHAWKTRRYDMKNIRAYRGLVDRCGNEKVCYWCLETYSKYFAHSCQGQQRLWDLMSEEKALSQRRAETFDVLRKFHCEI